MKLDKLHGDDRGEIYLLTGFKEYPEVTMFTTKEGYARGGCIHNVHDEYCCVLEGEIEYHLIDNSGDDMFGHASFKLKVGQTITIPKGTPHYFLSKTDSVVLEWGATPEEKKEKHQFMRKIVDDINGKKLASDML